MSEEKTIRDNWQREIEGAYLYRKLSEIAKDPDMKEALAAMAGDEEKHAQVWADRASSDGQKPREPRPDLRIHLTLALARIAGVEPVLGLLLNDEVSDFAMYAGQAQETGDEETYSQVLSDEAAHARAIRDLQQPQEKQAEEPWHRTASSGGWLRAVVYGFNDGLTANFGLVMGVFGGAVSDTTVLLAGFSGLVASALSMAGSGFLAARSEEEVRQHHLSLERSELKFMPKEERRELIHTYERRGLPTEQAEEVADQLMKKPEVALRQLARDELGIDPEAAGNPLREGITTGIATAIGAFIPVFPFLFLRAGLAVWVGVGISMIAHFAVGASRAIFTGRPALRSGAEMFAVGMGVAGAAYGIGKLFHIGV